MHRVRKGKGYFLNTCDQLYGKILKHHQEDGCHLGSNLVSSVRTLLMQRYTLRTAHENLLTEMALFFFLHASISLFTSFNALQSGEPLINTIHDFVIGLEKNFCIRIIKANIMKE